MRVPSNADTGRKRDGGRSMEAPALHETLGQLQRRNPRYAVEAYLFVLGGLHRRLAEFECPRHISGEELAGAVRDLAIERFGLLARVVLEHWGVHSTEDMGEIVFLLVDHGVLTKEDTDRREDFADVFSFEEVFESEYPWGAPGR
ncbi:MAG: hypothetical protein KAI98_07025 [Gemmatimonadetes bacterium]|nr:hypothetical protein [Gemmatimonadota bacterium]